MENKVIYAVKINPREPLPFCIIFDAIGGHENYVSKHFFKMGERDMDALEIMECVNALKRFRIYHYASIEALVKDEHTVGITTPLEVKERMFEFVNEHPFA